MNSGQRLVALSGLQSGSAASHFLAIVQGTGTGTGSTVIAYRSNVQMATPTLRATSREKRRDSFQAREPTTLRAKPNSKKYVYATTSVPRIEASTEMNDVFVTTKIEMLNI